MIITESADGTLNYQVFATPSTGAYFVNDPQYAGGGYVDFDPANVGKNEIVAYKEASTANGPVKEYIGTNGGLTYDEKDAWRCTNLTLDNNHGFYHYASCELDEKGTPTSGEYYKLEPGETTCYTILVWFEGSDPDHNNQIIGGGISFSIDYETEEYLKYLYELRKAENNQ